MMWQPRSTFTAQEREDRSKRLNASELGDIARGDWDTLYRAKTEGIEPDLSLVLPVQLGKYTEPFHIGWLTHVHSMDIKPTEHYSRILTYVEGHPMLCCTTDGMVRIDGEWYPLELKHVSQWTRSMSSAIDKYLPQLLGQMYCTGTRQAMLSVIFGNAYQEFTVVHWDQGAWDHLSRMIGIFWSGVRNRTPPEKPTW